ncbi:hypothetical protein F5B19DRAFT_500465 [Rostrohypoxylon terebratum]|nr:hypothetical protein F5B19DRAFT_500465 [Rostrohypoxylon terebratum]
MEKDTGTVASTATTQSVDTNPKVVAVIWGCLYKESFKKEMREKVPAIEMYKLASEQPEEEEQEEEEEAPPAPAAESQEAPKPKGYRVKVVTSPIPELEFVMPPGQTHFRGTKTIQLTYTYDVSLMDAEDNAGGSDNQASKSAPKSKKKASTRSGKDSSGPQCVREKHPRASVAHQMGWAPISQNGQPHPDNDNRNVADYEVGPSVAFKVHKCDIENDIFIFDRNVLSALQRPRDCNKNNVDIFLPLGNDTAQKARKYSDKEKVLLNIKNCAFNVNDPCTVMMYLDMLVRAHQEGGNVGDLGKKNLIFFSGPLRCEHEDCNILRGRIDRKYRNTGVKFMVKHPWWTLGDFCLRDPSSITFRTTEHAQDAMCGAELPDNARLDAAQSYQVMMWYRAMLGHHPTHLTVPGQGRTQFSIFEFEKKFPLLVDNANQCLTPRRATHDMAAIAPVPDPKTRPCKLCGEAGFDMGYYDKAAIPEDHVTGLMYLHYSDDEKYREEYVGDPADDENQKRAKRGRGRGKGKEKETEKETQKGKGKDKEKVANTQDGGAGAHVGTSASASAGTSNQADTNDDANVTSASGGNNPSADAGSSAGNAVNAGTANAAAGANADTSAGNVDNAGAAHTDTAVGAAEESGGGNSADHGDDNSGDVRGEGLDSSIYD